MDAARGAISFQTLLEKLSKKGHALTVEDRRSAGNSKGAEWQNCSSNWEREAIFHVVRIITVSKD
jgi:hypothetical protein